METSITLFRVRGVEIGVNWTWLIIFALIAWSLGSALFPATYPGLSGTAYLVMAVAAALLFFGSILVHELAHAFVGVHEGARIEGITLWLLGGVARFSGTPGSPGGEFRMTIVGPLTSFVLAGVFFAIAAVGDAAAWPDAYRGVADYLARINLIVAAFNLVPALPLDGGRVLRSWLWHRQRSFEAATASAALAGRVFGWLLIGIAVLGFLTGLGIGGLWFAVLGWFLLQASQAEAASALLRSAFRGRSVEDLMTPRPATVDADLDLLRFVDVASGPGGHSFYPVVDEGRLVGAASLRSAAGVDPEARGRMRVRDVMVPAAEVPTVRRTDAVPDAIPALQEGGGRALVVDDGHVAGMLSAADVTRAVEARRRTGDERPARGAGILVWVVVGVVMLAAAGYLFHPPLAVLSPQPAIDITNDVSITGGPTDEVNGRYLVTPVEVSRPNALGALFAAFDPNQEVVSLSAVLPAGGDPEDAVERQRDVFVESQQLAAAAAASAAGLDVTLDGSGARVVDVIDGSPADGILEPGDVIVAIDGEAVSVASDLRQPLESSPPGTTFEIEVERGDIRREVRLSTERVDLGRQTFVGLGVVLETRGLSVELPFDVDFRQRAVGGPSAGLAYALLITDLLQPADLAGGRDVAATGTVDPDGDVGNVGGVSAKVESARRAGADLFLVPNAAVGDLEAEALEVRGVSALTDALAVLENTA